ncbi:MAG: type 1 glutamine amidotransferase domain-containing protein [Chitinivibrionales bacterium]
MAKVAVVIDDFFEDVEYTEPVGAFQEKGHEITTVGLVAGRQVKGKKNSTPVDVMKSFDEVTAGDFDALLIPGGYSPDRLRAHHKPVAFVADFLKSGKPVFAICHAPQLLITADVLAGRKVTGYKSIIQDIKNAGAEFVDHKVVEDGNLISSRGPQDIPAFIRACLNRLG